MTEARDKPSCSSHGYYDVFLSFRGKDTRKSFTDHLYSALVSQGFLTFRDEDEAACGENVTLELEKAMRNSKSSIIVLSKDYASSPWCLDELVTILYLKKESEHIHRTNQKHRKHVVLPVFYDVKPSHLRTQTGVIAESFARYQKRIEEQTDPDKKRNVTRLVNGWKLALTEVADLIGLELQNHYSGHEAKFIEKIIKVIGDKLRRKTLHVALYEIGIDTRSETINRWVQDKTSDISVIAICGMGGIGKTTMAKYIYNQNSYSFEGSSFLANIREISKQPNGLVYLQTQLLSDITRKEHVRISSADEGLAKLHNLVSSRRVLIVLDDVDLLDQLQGICGTRDWLYPGSKVIITTRRERLLKSEQVYKVTPLDENESIKLFSLHASGEKCPAKGFVEHTERAVQICDGLPLALTVLGSSMSGKTEDEWVMELEKLEAVPQNQILDKLKISFDSLQDEYDKKIFLHIACFFVGTDTDYAIKVLEKCVDYVRVGIQNLIDRCLLTIDYRNAFEMHTLIQGMGRHIVNQESLEVGKRTRVWNSNEAFSVLRDETGSIEVEGLTLDMQTLKEDGDNAKKRRYEELYDKSIFSHLINSFKRPRTSIASKNSVCNTSTYPDDLSLKTDAFMSMKNLKLLKLNYVKLTGSYKDFPKCLVWLCWQGFPLETMPVELNFESLVALDLQHSALKQVWKETPFLKSLKILDLSYSESLARSPNLLGFPNLEKLILKGCVSLIEVFESIEYPKMLELIDLRDCKALRKLPSNIDKLASLKCLLIAGSNIRVLPNKMKNMKSLEVLDASGIVMRPLNGDSEEVQWWERIMRSMLSMPRTLSLDTFSAYLPCSLNILNLSSCGLSDSFSMNFANICLPLLRELNLTNNPLRKLTNFNRGFSGLKYLNLHKCSELQLLDLNGLGIETTSATASGCTSLVNIVKPPPHGYFSLSLGLNCDKLAEFEDCFVKESTEEIDMNLVRFMDLQVLFECGVCSLFFCGNEYMKFSGEKFEGSYFNFTVAFVPGGRIQFLKVWCMIENASAIKKLHVEIKNESKALFWKYFPDYSKKFVLSDRRHVNWWSKWSFGNQLETGDKISVQFGEASHEVALCGFKIMYANSGEGEEDVASDEKSHHDVPQLQLGIASNTYNTLNEEYFN